MPNKPYKHLRPHTASWKALRLRLRQHLKFSLSGEKSKIARFLGVHPSQVHRWTCAVCEHDTEPPYSLGKAIESYLDNPDPFPNLTHRTVFQAIFQTSRKTPKISEVIREGSDWEFVPLN